MTNSKKKFEVLPDKEESQTLDQQDSEKVTKSVTEDKSVDSTKSSIEKFDVKSKRADGYLNIKLPENVNGSEEKTTTITAINADDKKQITVDELRKLILDNDDLRQVIIEEIKVDNASRYRLLFDKKKDVPLKIVEDPVRGKPLRQLSENKKWLTFEERMNEDFLSDNQGGEQTQSEAAETNLPSIGGSKLDFYRKREELVEKLETKQKENFLKQKQDNDLLNKLEAINNSVPAEEEEEDKKDDYEDLVESKIFEVKDTTGAERRKPRLSIKKEEKSNEHSFYGQDDDELKVDPNLKHVQISKHVLSKREGPNKKVIATTYYKVKNHLELFKLGQSFLEDFKIGFKSFAFSNIHLMEDQRQTILGICAFFSNHINASPMVITSKYGGNVYAQYLGELKPRFKYIQDEKVSYRQLEGDGIVFIEFEELERVIGKLENITFEGFLLSLIANAEIVFWDLPELGQMQEERELYFPVVQVAENISFIVRRDFTRYQDIQMLENYFTKYGVKVKGLILGNKNKKKKE